MKELLKIEHLYREFETDGRTQRILDDINLDIYKEDFTVIMGADVLDLFTRFNRLGQSIIMVTHDIKSAIRGNRVLYLRDGKLINECRLGKYDGNNEERINKLNGFLGDMGW